MKYTTLGKSDLKVSRICLGCMGFGDAQKGMHSWTLPYEESKEIVKYALESGINFFDTAMGYQGGTSEEYLGRIIKECANREDVVIATKFVPRTESEIKNNISGQQHVENCLDASLKRLQMDYVDLYVYHFWDYNTPIEDIMEGLHNVIKQGKARYIGISNCYAYQLAKANAIARQNGWPVLVPPGAVSVRGSASAASWGRVTFSPVCLRQMPLLLPTATPTSWALRPRPSPLPSCSAW